MQVFVPLSSSLADCVQVLDKSRAGNQCWRESTTLWDGGWVHHPAHHLFGTQLRHDSMSAYHGAFCEYNALLIQHVYDSGWCSLVAYRKWHRFWAIRAAEQIHHRLPSWWGDERIHSSHRACLLAKDPEWYGQFGWSETPTPADDSGKWPYVWPKDLT